MTIKEALNHGIEELNKEKIEEPILKAKMILSFILEVDKEYLIIHDNEELYFEKIEKFESNLRRIIQGEPIQYILNKQEFMGYSFFVNENVLIPQPDTEILVEEVLNICKDKDKILDLCTGSGAIAVSIALSNKDISVFASDISEKALDVAKINSEKLGAKVNYINSDLFKNIHDKFDIIVSNPPYIESEVIKTLSKEVRREPVLALDGGEDGLDFYRKIILEASNYLNKDGYLCLEIGYDQKDKVIGLIEEIKKYKDIYCKKDLAGNDRIIICKKEG